jgi:hypothetical protein
MLIRSIEVECNECGKRSEHRRLVSTENDSLIEPGMICPHVHSPGEPTTNLRAIQWSHTERDVVADLMREKYAQGTQKIVRPPKMNQTPEPEQTPEEIERHRAGLEKVRGFMKRKYAPQS